MLARTVSRLPLAPLAALLSLALSVISCGGSPASAPAGGAAPAAGITASSTPASTTPSGPVRTLLAPLRAQNGGTITASLSVLYGAGRYTLRVEATRLHPNGRYLVNLHAGSCDVEDTSLAIEVGFLTGDASGNGSVERQYLRDYSVPAGNATIVTVHGYGGSGDEFNHIACGDLPSP